MKCNVSQFSNCTLRCFAQPVDVSCLFPQWQRSNRFGIQQLVNHILNCWTFFLDLQALHLVGLLRFWDQLWVDSPPQQISLCSVCRRCCGCLGSVFAAAFPCAQCVVKLLLLLVLPSFPANVENFFRSKPRRVESLIQSLCLISRFLNNGVRPCHNFNPFSCTLAGSNGRPEKPWTCS